jgi:hypothetical protein
MATLSFNRHSPCPGQATGFDFTVLADDTVMMYLDGQTGNALFMDAPGANHICQDQLPNCENPDEVSSSSLPANISAQILALLTPGTHTATFVVLNNNLIDMGLDFTATVDVAPGGPSVIPEPSSLLLLGTGLVSFARLIVRKVRDRA